ncbi:MAG: cytochrome c oxidase subunit 3 [Gammaproteobacteria bacterium]|nr:cytochrome c oxidase subunit 3 [Gammaproteobacteria bacterium]
MSPESETHVPGEVGVWVFVLGDMLVFGLFFTVFVYYRGLDIDVFLQAQTTLNPNYGALNTLLLLLSSWFVVLAVSDVREATGKIAPTLFSLAFVCGCGFAIVKFFEYGEKLNAGIGVTTNDFFMYYYIFTGIHFLHVLIGMGVLVFLWAMARAGVSETQDMKLMESGAIYWHMVDLLWIVLFPLLYLMR